jgi:hypothetical protein
MSDLSGTGPPWPASDGPPPELPGEPAELAALAAELPLAPRVWIPAEAEEAFYRLNHLPPRLAALFEGVASHDPDEDDVEDLAPAARALLAGHALLDEWVDAFYEPTSELGDRLRVRRPGATGRTGAAGRPALLALRRTWAEAWSDEAVLARLRASGSVALDAAPVLVHAADDAPAPPELASRVAEILGGPRAAFCLPDGRLTRLGSATRPESAPARG